MDVRLGLSLVLLLFHLSGTLSKNIRDGPNSRPRHNRRAALSEFLVPPPMSAELPQFVVPPTNLAPPPPPRIRMINPTRDSRHDPLPTPESPAYISRIMDWFNPFKILGGGAGGGGTPHQQYGPPPLQYGLPPQQLYRPPQQHAQPQQPSYHPPLNNQHIFTSNYNKPQPTGNYQSHQAPLVHTALSSNDRNCNPCNSVPWIPMKGQSHQHFIQTPNTNQNNFGYSGHNNNYLPPPISKPDLPYKSPPPTYQKPEEHYEIPSKTQLPPSDLDAYSTFTKTQSSIPNPTLFLSPLPPLFDKVQSFNTVPPKFEHSNSGNDYSSDSSESNHDIYSEPVSSETGSDTKTVPRESSVGEHIGSSKKGVNNKNNNQLEVIPAFGTKLSTEDIHYQESPVIDVDSKTQTQNPTVTNNGYGTGSLPFGDYVISGYDEDKIISTKTHSTTISTLPNQPVFKPYIDVKEIIRHENAEYYIQNINDSSSSEISSETYGPPIYRQNRKRDKQVQIIIPYTSQHTPSPFFHNEDLDSSASIKKPLKLSTSHKLEDNVVGQESQSIHVTQLPQLSFHLSRLANDTVKNNSIDVQRLQKNIDNWTIEEYSSGTTSSSILHNSSHPHLSLSKKIPHEYLTTSEPNLNIKAIDKFTDDIMSSYELNEYDESVVSTTQVPSNDSSTESFENSTHVTIVNGRPWSSSEMEKFWLSVPKTVSNETEKVFVVTSRTVSEIGDSRHKKKTEDGRKKAKKKKKSYEPIERAYQVLPQAVNNLAVASTGPENVPLWGIMEHEEITADKKTETKKRNNTTENLSPVLYVGHSKVSRASR